MLEQLRMLRVAGFIIDMLDDGRIAVVLNLIPSLNLLQVWHSPCYKRRDGSYKGSLVRSHSNRLPDAETHAASDRESCRWWGSFITVTSQLPIAPRCLWQDLVISLNRASPVVNSSRSDPKISQQPLQLTNHSTFTLDCIRHHLT